MNDPVGDALEEGNDPKVVCGNRYDAVAVQEEIIRPETKIDRPCQRQVIVVDEHDLQGVPGHHHDAPAVGLHQIRLVDPKLLEVGADHLGGCLGSEGCVGELGGSRCGDPVSFEDGVWEIAAAVEPIRSNEVDGVFHGPRDEVVAGIEWHEGPAC